MSYVNSVDVTPSISSFELLRIASARDAILVNDNVVSDRMGEPDGHLFSPVSYAKSVCKWFEGVWSLLWSDGIYTSRTSFQMGCVSRSRGDDPPHILDP